MKIIFILTSLILLAAQSSAAPICNIASEKKTLIGSLLCGQESVDEEYRQSGPGCFRRSIEKRLEDSAIQIQILALCGESELAKSMEIATVKAMEFMELLAPCVSESVEIRSILDERTEFVRKKAASLNCTASMREVVTKRKIEFESMVAQSKDVNLVSNILGKFGVGIDAEGNLFDR